MQPIVANKKRTASLFFQAFAVTPPVPHSSQSHLDEWVIVHGSESTRFPFLSPVILSAAPSLRVILSTAKNPRISPWPLLASVSRTAARFMTVPPS
jgi:hypothetical protein